MEGALSGWQYIFIATGVVGVLFAFVMFFFCPDWPDSTNAWFPVFTEDEGRFMAARLPPSTARLGDSSFDREAIKAQLRSPLLCECSTSSAFPLLDSLDSAYVWREPVS